MKPDWARGPEWEGWCWSKYGWGFFYWPFVEHGTAFIRRLFGVWIMKCYAQRDSVGLRLVKISIHLSPEAARKAAEALLEAME